MNLNRPFGNHNLSIHNEPNIQSIELKRASGTCRWLDFSDYTAPPARLASASKDVLRFAIVNKAVKLQHPFPDTTDNPALTRL